MPYDLPSFAPLSRVLRGENGLDHLITMEGWYWNSLDWMNDETEWKQADFVGMAWRAALEVENNGEAGNLQGNVVAAFTLCLKGSIKLRMDLLIAKEDAQHAPNDNARSTDTTATT